MKEIIFNKKLMSFYKVIILPLFLIFIGSCDMSEDPGLLNPPVADSTYTRCVNLSDGANIDMQLSGSYLGKNISYLSSTPHKSATTNQISYGIITKGNRTDTLIRKILNKSVIITYFVFNAKDSVSITEVQSNKQEKTDLASRNRGKIVFIQGINDSSQYLIKSGCQSGGILFNNLPKGGVSYQEVTPGTQSLYLIKSENPKPITNAEFKISNGEILYLISSLVNGKQQLYILQSEISNKLTSLQVCDSVKSSQSNLRFINTTSDSIDISIKIKGDVTDLLSNLKFLDSKEVSTTACKNINGDTLEVSNSKGKYSIPVKFDVGKDYLCFISGNSENFSFSLIERNVLNTSTNLYLLNCINPDTVSLTFGSGSPSGIPEGLRPFPDAITGRISNPIIIPIGNYPLIFNNSSSNKFIKGGFYKFNIGTFILTLININNNPSIVVFDMLGKPNSIISYGIQSQFFNLYTDTSALFEISGVKLSPIPYRYATTTLIPVTQEIIKSNLGDTTFSPTSHSYTIGTIGKGESKDLLVIPSTNDIVESNKSKIRIINGIIGVDQLAFRASSNTADPVVLDYKKPSFNFTFDSKNIHSFLPKVQQIQLLLVELMV